MRINIEDELVKRADPINHIKLDKESSESMTHLGDSGTSLGKRTRKTKKSAGSVQAN